jgi:hypothetical protein
MDASMRNRNPPSNARIIAGIMDLDKVNRALYGTHMTPKKGIIAWRKCPSCGHHEVGYTTEDGVFYPLKPGTMIQILDGPETVLPAAEAELFEKAATEEERVDGSEFKGWVPDPVQGNKRLRLKYGVLVKGPSFTEMSEELYRFAYLGKLERLIEKVIHTPVAVLLDRFFTAPHLAAGNPMQITEAMWRELEEIRRPVHLVADWLEKQDEDTLNKLVHPIAKQDLDHERMSEAEQKKELEELSLEEFLELL